MKKYFFLFLAVLSMVGLSAQQNNDSKVISGSIKSSVLNTDRTYSIYLPKNYETKKSKKYPILYLLHGLTDTNKNWFERGHVKDVMDQLVASGEAIEMIIVSPNAGGDIWKGVWNGYFDMPEWKYETFFFTEFLPYIEKNYRVIGNKQSRAVAGLSMGGGGTTVYAQKHSDMFCAAYPMSALMQREEKHTEIPKELTQWYWLNEAVKENDCVKFVENADEKTLEKLRSVKWFVDCGDDDFLLNYNLNFVKAMNDKKVPLEFRVRDGGHTWEYWHSALYTCLPFISRVFQSE